MVYLEKLDPSEPTLLVFARFYFMNILRKELTDIANEWNCHLLSSNRMGTTSARPDVMYFLPHLYGTTDHMISNDTAGTDKFIGITSAVYPLTFAMTLMSCRDTGE